MTDHIGIFEHCRFATPDPAEGYTTDDNTRALQLAVRLQKSHKDAGKLLPVYFRFLLAASTSNGFHNERRADGIWEDDGGIGYDWFGRAMLALADVAISGPEEFRLPALTVFDERLPLVKTVASIHTIALLLEALCQRLKVSFDRKDAILLEREAKRIGHPAVVPQQRIEQLINHLAEKLVKAYKMHSNTSWHWFEDQLTYENARLPEALLIAFVLTAKKEYRDIGIAALDFLLLETYDETQDVFSFIGNKGWYPKNGKKALFGQQPVDAAATVEACSVAYRVTNEVTYRNFAQKALAWYDGENILGLPLLDPATGGVLDGLEKWGVNPNEGAESVITYGLATTALQAMEKNSPHSLKKI